MSEKKDPEAKRKQFLEELLNHPSCTRQYLLNTIGIKERCLKNYLSELREEGFIITASKSTLTLHKTSAQDRPVYHHGDAKFSTLRESLMLITIQNSSSAGISPDELFREVNKISNAVNNSDLAVSKTLAADLSSLEKKHLIQKNSSGLYQITSNAPYFLTMSIEEAISLINSLDNYGHGHPYEHQLLQIRNKIALSIFDSIDSFSVADHYVLYEKACPTFSKIQSYLQDFSDYPYSSNYLSISFTDSTGQSLTLDLQVGLIVYSVFLDKLYLFCETDQTQRYIINYTSITKIEKLDLPNTIYQNELYKQLFRTMFTISTDVPEKVVVRFECRPDILQKLKRLEANRPSARIDEKDGYYYYEDTISGLSSFANYLRRFGHSCKVLSPESLQNAMFNSAKRVLEMYQKYGNREDI